MEEAEIELELARQDRNLATAVSAESRHEPVTSDTPTVTPGMFKEFRVLTEK